MKIFQIKDTRFSLVMAYVDFSLAFSGVKDKGFFFLFFQLSVQHKHTGRRHVESTVFNMQLEKTAKIILNKKDCRLNVID